MENILMSENASISDNDMINHGVPTDKLGKGNKQCRFRGCKLLAVKNAACDQHQTIIKADNAQNEKGLTLVIKKTVETHLRRTKLIIAFV